MSLGPLPPVPHIDHGGLEIGGAQDGVHLLDDILNGPLLPVVTPVTAAEAFLAVVPEGADVVLGQLELLAVVLVLGVPEELDHIPVLAEVGDLLLVCLSAVQAVEVALEGDEGTVDSTELAPTSLREKMKNLLQEMLGKY